MARIFGARLAVPDAVAGSLVRVEVQWILPHDDSADAASESLANAGFFADDPIMGYATNVQRLLQLDGNFLALGKAFVHELAVHEHRAFSSITLHFYGMPLVETH